MVPLGVAARSGAVLNVPFCVSRAAPLLQEVGTTARSARSCVPLKCQRHVLHRSIHVAAFASSRQVADQLASPAFVRGPSATLCRSLPEARTARRGNTTRVPPELEARYPEHDAATRKSHLPQWAKDELSPPESVKLLGMAMLFPLGFGAIAVHWLATRSNDNEEEAIEYSRTALSWTIHYAGTLLSFAGAAHWGMQIAELGVPKRSEYMAIYYVSRFSAPVVFILFGWVGSVLSASDPREASLWLLTGYTGLLSFDFLACGFDITPPWWFRWRAGFTLAAILSICVLLLSERNVFIGQKPMIRM